MCVGVTGIFMPDTLISVGRYVVTPNGLYAVAALRLGIGLVLMLVGGSLARPDPLYSWSRCVCRGTGTPFFGADRARAVFDWEATQGTALIRIGAVMAVLMGGFIAFAVAVGRRPA